MLHDWCERFLTFNIFLAVYCVTAVYNVVAHPNEHVSACYALQKPTENYKIWRQYRQKIMAYLQTLKNIVLDGSKSTSTLFYYGSRKQQCIFYWKLTYLLDCYVYCRSSTILGWHAVNDYKKSAKMKFWAVTMWNELIRHFFYCCCSFLMGCRKRCASWCNC